MSTHLYVYLRLVLFLKCLYKFDKIILKNDFKANSGKG